MVTGIVAALDEADHYTLTVALSDRQSGLVVAQSAARFIEAGLDRKPTRFFVESPVLVQDRSSEGYTKTTETPAGRAADAFYISQVETSALLADALAAYNAEKWPQALAGTQLPPSAPTGNSSGRSTVSISPMFASGNTDARGAGVRKIVESGSRRTTLP